MPRISRNRLKNPLPRLRSIHGLTTLALDGADHRGWYADAREQILEVAPTIPRPTGLTGVDPQTFAELLALFSPRTSVTRSIRWAVHFARTSEYMHDVHRSIRLAVEHWKKTGEIRGLKTAPFARALMGDPDALVLDSWMYKAIGIPPERSEVPTVHAIAASKVYAVARTLAWPIAETQAAIWAGIVREHGRNVPVLDIRAIIGGTEYPV